jgi:hypothetical protein
MVAPPHTHSIAAGIALGVVWAFLVVWILRSAWREASAADERERRINP